MEIKLFLEKYKNLGYSQKRIKEILLEIFEKNNFNLNSSQIEIKNTEVKMRISGVTRTQFILNKTKISKELEEKLKQEGLFVSKFF